MNIKRKQTILSVVAKRQSGVIVILEDIHDPHNAAAILRTCDSLGLQNVWFIFDKEKRYNPRRVGKASSSSANKWLDFETFSSTEDCLIKAKQDGYTILTTAIAPDAVTLPTEALTDKKIAVVLGNEHRGVSETAIRLADMVIHIPMKGFVQSLNVSVAAAIILWEITRSRNSHLDNKEKKRLVKTFLARA